jgi:hypothetical protein
MLAFDPGFCLFSVLKVIFYFRSRTVADFPVDHCVALSSLFDYFNCYGYFRGFFFLLVRCARPVRVGCPHVLLVPRQVCMRSSWWCVHAF